MLNKLFLKSQTLARLPSFSFATRSFTNFNEFQAFLKETKPVLGVMYFRAKWNPM